MVVEAIIMKPLCELVVGKILPTIRAAIVKVLIEEYKMKQADIANILGISQGSISLYVTSTRAKNDEVLELFPEISKYANETAQKIADGKITGEQISLCSICKEIRKNKKFSEYLKPLHRLSECDICSED